MLRRTALLLLVAAVVSIGSGRSTSAQTAPFPGAAAGAPEVADRRVALVVGNGRYARMPELDNPANDATDMAAALRSLGFEVMLATDLDQTNFQAAIRDFSRLQANAGVALFYYAGHGLQVRGRNFLLPIDVKLRARDLESRAIDVDAVLRSMGQDGSAKIVILDACRDNPLARSIRRASPVGRGLAPVRDAENALIAFATGPGNLALDGTGERNSSFTAALLGNIRRPGLGLRAMLLRVMEDVGQATGYQQNPWIQSSLRRDVFLAGNPGEAK